MDFSVRISPLQGKQENGTEDEKSINERPPLEVSVHDGRNLPLKLAQLLNSESEEPELRLMTRANSVGEDSQGSSEVIKTQDQTSLVNKAPGKSIMKINYNGSLQEHHGLMTPESLENLSPSGATATTEENEFVQCLEVDARKSTLLSKHLHLSWTEIREAVISRLGENSFTKGETDLIVLEWHSPGPIDFGMLEEECFSRSREAIQNLVSNLSDYYSDIPSPNLLVISTLETCLARREYLKSDVLKYLPEDLLPSLRNLLPKRLRMRPRWLQREMDFVTHCIRNKLSEEHLGEELVFRTPSQIRYKFTALTKKLEKVEPALQSETKTYDPKHMELIRHALKNDLTHSGILRFCGRALGKKIIEFVSDLIEEKGGSQTVAFTKGEVDYLRSVINSDYLVSAIQGELIFRSEEEISDKLKSLQIICVRQKKFASSVDRLMYEAQWYASIADSARGRKRRGRDDGQELADGSNEPSKRRVKPDMDEEATQKRRDMIERAATKRRETLRLKREAKERRLIAQQARLKTRSELAKNKRRLRHQDRPRTPVDSLLADADWFQSITGDGNSVQEGQKRIRKRTFHFVPEFETRHKMKLVKKKMEEKKIEQKRLLRKRKVEKKRKLKLRPGRRGRGRPRAEDYTDDSEYESEIESESEEEVEATPDIDVDDVSDDEEDEPSPFDPVNILKDTPVPLKGRQFFNDSIAKLSPAPLTVPFESEALMLKPSSGIPFMDSTAVDVVGTHFRNYKSLPKSFPPFMILRDGNSIINPRNIVRVRYLMYPEHTDAFILALPKSNELNPILEIQKMIQVHCALYFSHSQELQEHIYEEYCQKLKAAVENDKFNQFMIIIDRWNLLMLELTPYALKVDPSEDINSAIRYYLPFNYRKNHSVVDLNLNKFFFDVVNNGRPKKPRGRKPGKRGRPKLSKNLPEPKEEELEKAENGHAEVDKSSATEDIPESTYTSRYHNVRPAEYPESFLRILTTQNKVSRFAIQQILTAAYARIVGPNSRKLRSYKAFTAEVYGELLPSFISEVLTKVGLEPKHLFYDLGSGVGNTTFQAALEFGVKESGGCEVMSHASNLTSLQATFLDKKIQVLGLHPLNVSFALSQSFVSNEEVKKKCIDCNVVLVNNYLFEFPLNVEVGKLLYGLKPGSKIISLKNFIPPRYKAGADDTILDYLKVEKFEMSDFFSVSWTANKVPYYISTVQKEIRPDYL